MCLVDTCYPDNHVFVFPEAVLRTVSKFPNYGTLSLTELMVPDKPSKS